MISLSLFTVTETYLPSPEINWKVLQENSSQPEQQFTEWFLRVQFCSTSQRHNIGNHMYEQSDLQFFGIFPYTEICSWYSFRIEICQSSFWALLPHRMCPTDCDKIEVTHDTSGSCGILGEAAAFSFENADCGLGRSPGFIQRQCTAGHLLSGILPLRQDLSTSSSAYGHASPAIWQGKDTWHTKKATNYR